jgi:hypothetical protein
MSILYFKKQYKEGKCQICGKEGYISHMDPKDGCHICAAKHCFFKKCHSRPDYCQLKENGSVVECYKYNICNALSEGRNPEEEEIIWEVEYSPVEYKNGNRMEKGDSFLVVKNNDTNKYKIINDFFELKVNETIIKECHTYDEAKKIARIW